jgi:non-ribosomal peptide synthetase component F
MTTFMPASAHARAIPSPIPLEPPVMKADLPATSASGATESAPRGFFEERVALPNARRRVTGISCYQGRPSAQRENHQADARIKRETTPLARWDGECRNAGVSIVKTRDSVESWRLHRAEATPDSCRLEPPGRGVRALASKRVSSHGVSTIVELCIHKLFEKQVSLTPQSTAISCGERDLTYFEVNRAADEFAAHLRRIRPSPAVVGVATTHSPAAAIAILGALKAGAAFAPIGPNVRLTNEDAPNVIVVDKLPDKRFGATEARHLIALDESVLCGNDMLVDDAVTVAPADWACVLLRTTAEGARQCAVVLEHRCIASAVEQACRHLEIDAAFTVLSIADAHDPVFLLELFVPLLTGGSVRFSESLLFINRSYAQDHEAMLFANAVAIDNTLDGIGLPKNLRRIVLVEDVVSRSLVQRLSEAGFADALYGVFCRGEAAGWTAGRAIGLDADNVFNAGHEGDNALVVLGPDFGPAAIGVDGELFVRGPSVGFARTAIDFAGLPTGPHVASGVRQMSTGCVGHYLADGRVRVIGHKPHGMEVRDEHTHAEAVESQLCELPNVREAVVVANGAAVTAFLTLRSEGLACDLGEVRRLLSEFFPDVAIECAVLENRLPVGADGRIDYAALAAYRPASTAPAPALTATLQALVAIWQTVLGREGIAAGDDFFDLGGTSIDAYVACSQISSRFAMDVTIIDFYSTPTIGGMADRIDSALRSSADGTLAIAPTRPPKEDLDAAAEMLHVERRVASAHREPP